MYNLHCHSLLSDGVLLPSEIAARYAALGYKAIAITDHVDYCNISAVMASINDFIKHWPKNAPLIILPGVEITHIPPEQAKDLVRLARKGGMKVVIGHGETTMEPVAVGTNRAFIEAGVDILAHPGKITDADVLLAKERGVFLEITARAGHRHTNTHVASSALRLGAQLILDIDSHIPEDILTPQALREFGVEAGLTPADIEHMYVMVAEFLKRKGAR